RRAGVCSDLHDEGDVLRQHRRSGERGVEAVEKQSSNTLARGFGNETESDLFEQRRLSLCAKNANRRGRRGRRGFSAASSASSAVKGPSLSENRCQNDDPQTRRSTLTC